VAPGEVLQEWMLEHRQTIDTLSALADIPEEVVVRLLGGRENLTPELAEKLHAATGISVPFWLGAERNYRDRLERLIDTAVIEQDRG
jgi:plasmid maintenance system antidote protein VapI